MVETVELVAENVMSLGEVSSLPRVKMAVVGHDLDHFRATAFPRENFEYVNISQGIVSDTNDFGVSSVERYHFHKVLKAVFRLASLSHISFYRVPWRMSGAGDPERLSIQTLGIVSP